MLEVWLFVNPLSRPHREAGAEDHFFGGGLLDKKEKKVTLNSHGAHFLNI